MMSTKDKTDMQTARVATTLSGVIALMFVVAGVTHLWNYFEYGWGWGGFLGAVFIAMSFFALTFCARCRMKYVSMRRKEVPK